jgi:hypothetical protein
VNFDDLDDLDPEAYQGPSLSLGERLRLHEVTPERVRLAAFLGHAEARALGEEAWTPAPDAAGLREVEAVLRAGDLGPKLVQRAAAEAAARVLDLAEGGPAGAILRRCVRVARGAELLDEAAVEALLEEAYAVASQEGAGSAALACATSARTVLGGPLAGAAAAKTFALALDACAEADAAAERDWQRESLIGLLLESSEEPSAPTVFGDPDEPDAEPRDPELAETGGQTPEPALDSALQETVERAPASALQETVERAPASALQETVERAPAPLASTLERPAPLFARESSSPQSLAPEPQAPRQPQPGDSSLGRFSYDEIPDDPFAGREPGPDWRENPWIQGGFCVALALVLAFFGTVPIALAIAALAVAVLYPIVPKFAELAALVLGSCLAAFFMFELLRSVEFFELLQGGIALVVGWGPITLWLRREE